MTMERRMEAIEEISRLLINASRGMNESIQRLETLQRQREGTLQELSASVRRLEILDREREETLQALSESIRVTNEALQSLMAFVPATQAEIIRLDSSIDQIEGR